MNKHMKYFYVQMLKHNFDDLRVNRFKRKSQPNEVIIKVKIEGRNHLTFFFIKNYTHMVYYNDGLANKIISECVGYYGEEIFLE